MNISNDYSKKSDSGVNASCGAPQSGSAKSQDKPNTVFKNNETTGVKKSTLNEKELKYLLSQGYDVSKMSNKEIEVALEPLYLEGVEKPSGDATSKVKVNYDDKDTRTMGFPSELTGVFACDFYSNLTEEQQENFIVTSFARKQFGQSWENMSDDDKAKAMQSIEAQLEESVPSWKDLSPKDKAAVGICFITASDEREEYLFDGDETKNSAEISKLPMNEQIERVAQKIIAEKNEQIEKSHATLEAKFNQEIDNSYKGKKEDVYEYQLEYLANKVKKSGVESLNEFELQRYNLLKDTKKAANGKPLKLIFSEINVDKENSTFAKMKKDEHYNEILTKRMGEIYNRTENKEYSIKQSEIEAKTDWFIHQFEGIDPTDKKALVSKYFELRDNCASIEEMAELQKLALKVKGLGISDNKDAALHYSNIVHSKNAEEQVKGTHSIVEAHQEGRVDGDIILGITNAIPDDFETEAVAGSTIALTRASSRAAVAVVNNTKNGKYSVEQQEAIYEDPVKNPDLQIDKKTTNILGEAIGHTDSSLQLELNKKYADFAILHKDTDLMKSIAAGIPEYSKENQTPAFKNILTGSENFDDKDAIEIQKTLSNQIAKSDKSNQLDMHNDIMNSKFSEVQEQAASNIKDYDHSVQVEAIDKVYETKNSKAVQAVIDNLDKMPPQVQQVEAARLVGEIALSSVVESGLLETKLMNGSLTTRELMQLTPTQRREYFVKQFTEASPAKKLEILKKLASASSGVYKKTIYTIIARFSAPLLKSMVESGLGKSMLDAGLPIDAVNKIINVMKTSTNNDVIEQLKELKLDSSFEKYFDKKEDADVSDIKSVTIPPEFGNDVKKIFAKKGNKGNALMDIKS